MDRSEGLVPIGLVHGLDPRENNRFWPVSIPIYLSPFPFPVEGGRIPPIFGRRNLLLLDQNEVRCSDEKNRSMRDFTSLVGPNCDLDLPEYARLLALI